MLRHIRLLIVTLFAVAFATAPAEAQALRTAVAFWNYELDATTYTFCVFTGSGGQPWTDAPDNAGPAPIKTTGSSTSVTAVTAATAPFRDLAVGDYIAVTLDRVTTYRFVATKTDNDNITVNTAVDWENAGAGRVFTWRRRTCGTTATNGWFNVGGYGFAGVSIDIAQMNAASIDIKIEGRDEGRGANPLAIWPPNPLGSGICEDGNFTTVATCEIDIDPSMYAAIRVGMKINTDDGGDTGANAEDVSVRVKVRPLAP